MLVRNVMSCIPQLVCEGILCGHWGHMSTGVPRLTWAADGATPKCPASEQEICVLSQMRHHKEHAEVVTTCCETSRESDIITWDIMCDWQGKDT